MNATSEHPASQAWSRLSPACGEPRAVVTLKRKAKGSVYRLEKAGLGGADVIAKLCRRDKAEVEHLVYQDLYSRLPESTLHYYGSTEEAGCKDSWLFLEDVGDQAYDPTIAEHRTLAAAWFATAHVHADQLGLRSRLPAREPAGYREYLRDILSSLPVIAADRPLDRESRRVLDGILESCGRLERDFDRIEAYCEGLPRTLVHGDCLRKNVHVRSTDRGRCVVPFDWGGAGWGLVATDLGQLALPYGGAMPPQPDFEVYRSIIADRWPRLDLETIVQLSNLGQLFWALKVISREIPAFDYEWATLADTVANFRIYACALHDALRLATW